MNAGIFKIVTCDCGHVMIACQPEQREMFGKMADQLGDDYSLVVLEGDRAICPKCCKPYDLPPAETFDVERHPAVLSMMGIIEELEKRSPSEREYPMGDDVIPF